MTRTCEKYRIPICCALAVVLIFGFSSSVNAQIKEQLYHDNVIPEHLISSLSPKVFLSAYTFHRSQWTGVSSSPKTTGIGVNYRLKNNLSAQLYYGYDRIQLIDNQNIKIGAIYSLGKDNRLSFGLRFGLNVIGQNQNYLSTDPVSSDPLLSNSLESATAFDADFSIGYNINQFKIGLGINNLLESGFSDFGVNSSRIMALALQNNFSVNFFGSKNVFLSAMYRAEIQSIATGQIDVKSLVFLTPKFGLGAGFRYRESVPLLLQYRGLVSNLPFVVQYSYDVQIGYLSTYNAGSHEITLRINLKNKPLVESELDFEERERKSKNVRFL